MGKCIKCGINFIGTAANPPSDGLCKYCEIDQLKAEVADLRSKNRAWALGIEQSNTDTVDMQRDEFKRIIALNPSAEIIGICERAIACIEQTVPVIVQRDQLQSERNMLRRALAESLAFNINWTAEAEPADLAYYSEYKAVIEQAQSALAATL